jgi:hypothetical protein
MILVVDCHELEFNPNLELFVNFGRILEEIGHDLVTQLNYAPISN